jgi:AbrB family looped-hinge helix DNA binding protein
MLESTITIKGQTTVPSEVRELIHAAPGTRLVWTVAPDGSVIVRVKNRSILELEGSLRGAENGPVSTDEMNPWR